MKQIHKIGICILTIILLAVGTACGGNSAPSAGQTQETGTVAATEAQPGIAEQSVQSADSYSKPEQLLGSWTDISSPDRFVNITQSGTDYRYEDNEGTYPAVYEDGKLKVTVSETDTAEVYVDLKSGHLLSVYQDNISEYQKK